MIPSRAFLQQIFLAFVVLLLPVAASFAQKDPSRPLRVVLKGHDAVAYFTENKPVKGNPKIHYDWDGERYLFAGAANRDKFAANPERFAPQYGGYCTGTMARGGRAEADPEAWIVADGRLYMFGSVKFMEIARNDRRWLTEKVAMAGGHWQAKK